MARRHRPYLPYRILREKKHIYGYLVTSQKSGASYLLTGEMWVVEKDLDVGKVAIEEFEHYPCNEKEVQRNTRMSDIYNVPLYVGDRINFKSMLNSDYTMSGTIQDECNEFMVRTDGGIPWKLVNLYELKLVGDEL